MLDQRPTSPRETIASPADLPKDLDALRAPRPGALSLTNAPAEAPGTKLMLVDFRSGETVSRHPEIQAYLRQGWRIKSAAPRLVESGGTKLLVVLTLTDANLRRRNADAVPAA